MLRIVILNALLLSLQTVNCFFSLKYEKVCVINIMSSITTFKKGKQSKLTIIFVYCFQDETILSVFKYLDTQSLCRCAQVNKHFRRIACDAILYRCIDLRPYWHCLRSEVSFNFILKMYNITYCNEIFQEDRTSI